jgi:diguanylate cyclase (GGDEF)-like protein
VAARTAELRVANARLQRDALHDALTDLPNRAMFLERLDRALVRVRAPGGPLAGVLFVDLDRFKLINDSLGHLAGDRLLVAAAAQLAACVRPGDTVARLGGDEFAILLEGIQSAGDAAEVAGRLQSRLMAIDLGEGFERPTTASIGIAIVSADYRSAADILRDADTAMYRAKSLGRARHQVFDMEMHHRVVMQLRLESDLRRALERGEIVAHYQPVVSGADGRIVGLEALARWHHPERGLVMPDQFISVAEESGLIASIDEQVLRQACAQARIWREAGWPDLWVSVNVSGRQFHERNLPRLLRQALDEAGLPGSAVRIEVTESVAMSSLEVTAGTLRELGDLGVEAALDDFGMGYSSMGYLTRFPLRSVKIDRSFVRASPGDAESATIIGAIVAMAHSLDLKVVAEGVETVEQLASLQAQGVDAMQGYLFSRPLPADQAAAHLRRARQPAS